MARRSEPRLKQESVTRGLALGALLLMVGFAVAGPSGLLAWGDNVRLLEQRNQELERVKQEREVLRNRVALLDPVNTDPDLAGELLRRNLNVVHQDEMVMILPKK